MASFRDKTVRWFVSAAILASCTYFVLLDSISQASADGERQRDEAASRQEGNARGRPFKKQQNRDAGAGGRRAADEWPLRRQRAWVRAGYSALAGLYAAFTANYFVLCLLDLDSLERFRYLDCLLPGRVNMEGKFSGSVKYTVVVFCLFQLSWLIIMVHLRPKLRLACLEFLLLGRAAVASCEAEFERQLKSPATPLNLRKFDPILANAMLTRVIESKPRQFGVAGRRLDLCPTCVKLQAARAGSGAAEDERPPPPPPPTGDCGARLLRPTRDSRAWRRLARLTWYYALGVLALAAVFLPLAATLIRPVLITQRGFELSHANCADYLARRPALYEQRFRFLRLDPERFGLAAAAATNASHQPAATKQARVFILPLVKLRELDTFELIRRALDIAANAAFWLASGFAFLFDTYIAVLIAADTLAYTRVIRLRALELARYLRQMQAATSHFWLAQQRRDDGSNDDDDDDDDDEEDDNAKCAQNELNNPAGALIAAPILTTQTLIVDFFGMIEQHNAYVAFYLLYCILFWLVFSTATLLSLMNLERRGQLGRAEIYALELVAMAYFAIICSLYATARQLIQGTYARLASLMALDNSSADTKQRWRAILRHFQPSPLHCFSMFRSREISWLFGLKLIAWVLSAFLVVLSFHKVHLGGEG